MSKHFLRAMAQPFERSQLGVSLWDEATVSEKQREEEMEMAKMMQ